MTHELQRLTVPTMLRYVRLGLAPPRHLPRCKRRWQLLSTATPTPPLRCTVIRPTTCDAGGRSNRLGLLRAAQQRGCATAANAACLTAAAAHPIVQILALAHASVQAAASCPLGVSALTEPSQYTRPHTTVHDRSLLDSVPRIRHPRNFSDDARRRWGPNHVRWAWWLAVESWL